MTTRRKFVKIAGATAATAALPRIGVAQNAGPPPIERPRSTMSS
jgi:hypothetical protein